MADEPRGQREMVRLLRALPTKVRKRVVTRSLKDAAEIIKNAATASALSQFQGEGMMAENITTARGKPRRYGELRHRVGVAGGARDLSAGKVRASSVPTHRRGSTKHFGVVGFTNEDGAVYYWRFLEFGTSKMPARPFMRPAGQLTLVQQISTIKKTLKRGVEREARKLAKQ